MTLNQCTKEELIFIINRLLLHHVFGEEQRQLEIEFRLSEVKFQRQQKLLKEADNWNVIATEKRKEYIALLNPYGGKKLIDVPVDVLKKADQILKEAKLADKKFDECMRKVEGNG